jgi:hypothetical protein
MASIKCYFVVVGSGYDPSVLTEALGVQPTRTWRRGEVPSGLARPHQTDGWSIDSEAVESLDLQEVALPLLQRLSPSSDTLRDYCNRLNLEAELGCTVFIKDKLAPAIHLDRETVRMLDQLGAELDIDIYCLDRSSE